MLANAAARRGYSITPTSPSSRLIFIWGLVVSASEKSIMFEWFAYILSFFGVDSPLPSGTCQRNKLRGRQSVCWPSFKSIERTRTFWQDQRIYIYIIPSWPWIIPGWMEYGRWPKPSSSCKPAVKTIDLRIGPTWSSTPDSAYLSVCSRSCQGFMTALASSGTERFRPWTLSE